MLIVVLRVVLMRLTRSDPVVKLRLLSLGSSRMVGGMGEAIPARYPPGKAKSETDLVIYGLVGDEIKVE